MREALDDERGVRFSHVLHFDKRLLRVEVLDGSIELLIGLQMSFQNVLGLQICILHLIYKLPRSVWTYAKKVQRRDLNRNIPWLRIGVVHSWLETD